MSALRIVVAAGADLSHCDSEKWTALHVAASMDDIPAAIFILKWCREDLTQFVSIDGERPIDLAQSPEMIQLLQFAGSMRNKIVYTQERVLSIKTQNENLHVLHRRRLTFRLTNLVR